MTNETVSRVRDAISGIVAVAQFAREDWVDDPEAVEAGYTVTDYGTEMIGESPVTPVYMEGPGDWRPAFRADQAWRELGNTVPMTVDYQPATPGNDALGVTVVIPADTPEDAIVLTIGCDTKNGLYADPVTIEALGGDEAGHAHGNGTGATAPVRNMADAGVENEQLKRTWEALNEVAQSHPAAMLWHDEMGGCPRDLPHFETLDRARQEIDAMAPPPDGAIAPGQAAGSAADKNLTIEHSASRQ